MPIPRNRPQFKAAVSQEEVPPPIDRPLSYVRSATVKSLLWRHYALLVLCALWSLGGFICVAMGIAAFAGFIPKLTDDQVALLGALSLFSGALQIVTALGCWLRAKWGRVCGFVLGAISLLGFPLGTLNGIFILVVFFRSAPLFGPSRFSGGELAEEHRYRKRRNK